MCFPSRLLTMMPKQNIHVFSYISIIILYIFFLKSISYLLHSYNVHEMTGSNQSEPVFGRFQIFSPPVETRDHLSSRMAETETTGPVYLWFCRVNFWSGSWSLKLDFKKLSGTGQKVGLPQEQQCATSDTSVGWGEGKGQEGQMGKKWMHGEVTSEREKT